MKKISIVLTVFSVFAAGCAQPPNYFAHQNVYTTQASIEKERQNRLARSGQEAGDACTAKAKESPSYQVVEKNIFPEENNPNKYSLLSSKAKLNEAQKKALKEYLALVTPCRKIYTDAAQGLPFAAPMENANSKFDLIYAKLLSGQLSIGEANEQRNQARQVMKSELSTIQANVNQNLEASHNAEIQNAQQRRAAEIQAAQQQQLINQQQMKNQQEIWNKATPKPVPAPKQVNTNCMNLGAGMISCTSY